jgi:poly-beta-hydroxyalkanoate depolymerase
MLYLAYQAHSDMVEPAKSMARSSLAMLGAFGSAANVPLMRNLSAAYELIARAGLTHVRPSYGIRSVTVGNREVAVSEVRR